MGTAITALPVPDGTLLDRYRANDGYVDCFAADLRQSVPLPAFIGAFYTSRAFRPERWLIGAVLGMRAQDADAARLASGESAQFSAWTVEERRENEILMCDYQGKTRSWLMVQPVDSGTRLYFGSAVVPAKSRVDRAAFHLLLRFHRIYSRVLLGSAIRCLQRA